MIEYVYRLENIDKYFYMYRYKVIRETKCGVWIKHPYKFNKNKFILLRRFSYNNTTHSSTVKRFANTSENGAIASFAARKRRQIKILKSQLEYAESSLYHIMHINKSDIVQIDGNLL